MKDETIALHTYANPLSLPAIPFGTDDWCRNEHGMSDAYGKPADDETPDYRSISDPTVFFHGGKWYMYPSYGMAWVSEDFEHWKHIRTSPYHPKYSPAITEWKDGKFLLTAWYCPLYVSDSPVGPFALLGDFVLPNGETFCPCDPALFRDDDGRLYLYEVKLHPAKGTPEGFSVDIVGYELDRKDPTRIVAGPFDIVRMDPQNKPWERHGRYHQDPTFGWVEGPHLLKYRGRYYMIYAAPDTCDASYCMAVAYADDGPLGRFVPQKRNPLTACEHGLITGAGHGCVERGPGDTLWAFYTIATPYVHRYERRIGMDLVAVDENGELYCPFGVTDTPQYVPAYRADPVRDGNAPGLYNLTAAVRPTVSSHAEGRDAVYATDENNLSFWMPAAEDSAPTIECALSGRFDVGAVRLFFRELGLDVRRGILPAPIGYLLEGECDGVWFPLVDRRENDEERNIDYRSFPLRSCEKVRLTITKKNPLTRVGLIDFAVFGRRAEEDNGLKLVTIGDSVTKGTFTPAGGTVPDHIASPNFAALVGESLGAAEIVNYGRNGISFSSLSPVESAWALTRRIGDMEAGDVTILAAGTNDFGTCVPLGTPGDVGDISFCGAVAMVLDALRQKATGRPVYVVTPIRRAGEAENRLGLSLQNYRDALADIARAYGFPVIDGAAFPMDPDDPAARKRYMPDGTHPNEEGHRLYAAWLLTEMRWHKNDRP